MWKEKMRKKPLKMKEAPMNNPGTILRIDLTTGTINQETIPVSVRRKYLGGGGINDWLLWEHFLGTDIHIDPLSPENVLIVGTGLLDGLGYGIGGKVKWTFKSPMTNLFGDTASGGRFGSTMKCAGYDHVVITGKSDKPVYIRIDDDDVKIMDASHLWGKDVVESDALIKEDYGDDNVDTALIGAGAENLVRYGCIMVCRHRCGGRAGGGAVLGSKNLKGIAVRGTKGFRVHDPMAMFNAKDEFIKALKNSQPLYNTFRKYGTTTLTAWYNMIGINALNNNQYCILTDEEAAALNHRFFTKNLAVSPLSCSGCIVGCSTTYKIKGTESPAAGRYKGEVWTRPEYGGMAGLGIMVGILDWPAVCHFWMKSDLYGLDVIELGASIAFLMELWQRGIITEQDVEAWMGEPLSLEWGNVEAVEKLIDAAARQNNDMGRLMDQGVYAAAKKIEKIKNVPVLQYALYGKGRAAFIEDVRNTPSWAINQAVASRGADHLKGIGTLDKINDPALSEYFFGRPDGADPHNTKLKGAGSAVCEDRSGLLNSLGLCTFTISNPLVYTADMFARAIHAATGLELSGDEVILAGKRAVNLEKAFNSRLGLKRKDDMLCDRWLKEPMPDGPGKGWKAEDYLEDLKSEYYEWHGWDRETSLQKRETLEGLGMEDVATVLLKEKALG
jgi:aldehyde:ferredoxin oxidoreductase